MLNFVYRCFEKKPVLFVSLLNTYYKRTSFLNTITCILIYRVLKYQNFLEFHFSKTSILILKKENNFQQEEEVDNYHDLHLRLIES